MNLIQEFKISIIGFIFGIMIAILFITIGFFKMIVILALGLLGSIVGYYINQRYIKK